jgi:hypothetical protein
MTIAVIALAAALQFPFPTKRSIQTMYLHMSTRDHPQSDGQTKNANDILEDTLRHFVGSYQRDWDQHLSAVEFAMHNSYHSGIKSKWEVLVSKIKHVYICCCSTAIQTICGQVTPPFSTIRSWRPSLNFFSLGEGLSRKRAPRWDLSR